MAINPHPTNRFGGTSPESMLPPTFKDADDFRRYMRTASGSPVAAGSEAEREMLRTFVQSQRSRTERADSIAAELTAAEERIFEDAGATGQVAISGALEAELPSGESRKIPIEHPDPEPVPVPVKVVVS